MIETGGQGLGIKGLGKNLKINILSPALFRSLERAEFAEKIFMSFKKTLCSLRPLMALREIGFFATSHSKMHQG